MNHTFFPLALVEDILRILKERNAIFACYGDLVVKPGELAKPYDYAREFTAWQIGRKGLGAFIAWRSMRSLARRTLGVVLRPEIAGAAPARPVVFFQHDADANPECTLRLMELEHGMGVRSSNYFFQRSATDEPYELDLSEMKRFEALGFEIGYHQNAYERSGYNLPTAFRLLRDDVEFFRSHFRLRSFVPHGGKPGPDGLNNERLPLDEALRGLIWGYGWGGVITDQDWSEGHVEYDHGGSTLEDPRDFARRIGGHTRIRMLLHPQYYGDVLRPDWERFALSKQRWWRALWNL